MTQRAKGLALPDLVRTRRAELGYSMREVAAASGGLISHGRVGSIENGQVGEISDRLLRGLAAALALPIRTLREAAGLPAQMKPFVLPERANRLTQRERQLVLNLVDALLTARSDK